MTKGELIDGQIEKINFSRSNPDTNLEDIILDSF